MQIKNPKDFWAGLMFIVVGVFFVVVAVGTPDFINRIWGDKLIPGYQIGSAVRMGPAYFPVVLGGLLTVLGAIVFFRSFVSHIAGEAQRCICLSTHRSDRGGGCFRDRHPGRQGIGIANDYAMLASALIVSVLSVVYRPRDQSAPLILASSLAFAYLLKPLGLVFASAH
jgi:hypothetical protein